MPEKKRPKKPKKETPPTKNHTPPTKKWQERATKHGFKIARELSDELINQVLLVWSEDDPHKSIIYLWGVLQGIALQVGRIESLLAHSGYVHPQALRHMCIERMSDAYEVICNSMEHDNERGAKKYTLKELLEVVAASSLVPRKPARPEPTRENIIPLPVFAKKKE